MCVSGGSAGLGEDVAGIVRKPPVYWAGSVRLGGS
jgi:hypothetical protein